MIKTVFFDFDGVLVESTGIKTDSFGQLFISEGRDVADKVTEYHLDNAGVSRFDKFRYIYREILDRPLPDDEFKRLCDDFSSLVLNAVIKTPFVKGAKEFLDQHHKACDLFVMTATPHDEIMIILQRRDMSRYFKAVYGAPMLKTDSVRLVIEQERLSPSETVYIGDAMSDHNAALNNSVPFIARIHDNESIFKTIECTKIRDLEGLNSLLF